MKYYISNFYNLRYFKNNYIPISTCASDPWYFHSKDNKYCKSSGYYINENNVLCGIREESLSPLNLSREDCPCEKNCRYLNQNPNCPFLINYNKYLKTVDFVHLLNEFKRIANDVQKITNYTDEPAIVLLVYEAENNPCSERDGLIKLFKNYNIDLIEFRKEN